MRRRVLSGLAIVTMIVSGWACGGAAPPPQSSSAASANAGVNPPNDGNFTKEERDQAPQYQASQAASAGLSAGQHTVVGGGATNLGGVLYFRPDCSKNLAWIPMSKVISIQPGGTCSWPGGPQMSRSIITFVD